MVKRLFGTDGIRGKSNTEPMTAQTALKVGMAAGIQFKGSHERPRVVIGKDTRLSGYMLEPALTSGFIAVGMDVILAGPIPTPAVAMLTRSLRADMGVMISASHNPYYDNGIKLFGPNGTKLSDEMERSIEALVAQDDFSHLLAAPDRLGRAKRLDDAAGRYIEYVKNTFPKGSKLSGLKIVIDCAHGAAYHVAKTILWELGAEVIEIGVSPNGMNINDGCGSTQPDLLCRTVVEHKADIGIALDGDADRVVIADETGHLIDGDQLMATIATSWHKQGLLRGKGVVATVMSNLGMERYLESLGLHLVRTAVGDRHVADHMRQNGYNVGGEQSGHIILSDYCTTGDGLIAALQLLSVIIERREPASQVCRVFTPYPQLLRNIRYQNATPLDNETVKKTIAQAESLLGTQGRLVIRKSGTEPLIRIMAEAENEQLVHRVVNDIAQAVEQALV